MKVLVIDGQGGQLGSQLIKEIRAAYPALEVTAVGTNSAATAAMLKAGAQHAATGENAVLVGCRKADVIIGPVGMVIADSLYGEFTPKMKSPTPASAMAFMTWRTVLCGTTLITLTNRSFCVIIEPEVRVWTIRPPKGASKR